MSRLDLVRRRRSRSLPAVTWGSAGTWGSRQRERPVLSCNWSRRFEISPESFIIICYPLFLFRERNPARGDRPQPSCCGCPFLLRSRGLQVKYQYNLFGKFPIACAGNSYFYVGAHQHHQRYELERLLYINILMLKINIDTIQS